MVGSLKEAYDLIRLNGEHGMYTRKAELSMPNLNGYLVIDVLTYMHMDIAEEDDGTVFSVEDWKLISTMVEQSQQSV